MMTTPICDFVEDYSKKKPLRLHMPGHKGENLLGFEEFDITEINGADSLFEADGIIAESERNASLLFGGRTFFSTEGSSHCIRAMMFLIKTHFENVKILAGRNSHKAFLSAAALLDLDVDWLYPHKTESYLSGKIQPEALEKAILQNKGRNIAVYITTPDYLGNIADLKTISEICKKHGAILAVDNAHGAYLRFLPESAHPLDLGADICCDSAHKTLPVITGGAYLHISKNAPEIFCFEAKNALSLFGSTSPSYLILQSLDKANPYLFEDFKKELSDFIPLVEKLKRDLENQGFVLTGEEKLKIVIQTKKYGYYGTEIGEILAENNIFFEFADKDYIVLMLTPKNGKEDLEKLKQVLFSVPKKEEIREAPPEIPFCEKVLSPKETVFAKSEVIPTQNAQGRILSQFNISCPPAVPIVVCGERIHKKALDCFEYYGIKQCRVVKT